MRRFEAQLLIPMSVFISSFLYKNKKAKNIRIFFKNKKEVNTKFLKRKYISEDFWEEKVSL